MGHYKLLLEISHLIEFFIFFVIVLNSKFCESHWRNKHVTNLLFFTSNNSKIKLSPQHSFFIKILKTAQKILQIKN